MSPQPPTSKRATSNEAPKPLLDLHEVVVTYGGVVAVDRVSFSVAPGELVGIIGANGSGKTTMLDTISGQLRPAGGRVAFDGVDLVDHLPEDRAALGLVRSFQDARLYPELTVEETLLVAEDARRPAGVLASALQLPGERLREAEKRARMDELVANLGLEPFRHNLVDELSTGTRRIVDLATIVSARPRLLLLDEPTAGIAQREAEAFGPLLRRLHQITGAAVCLVEHDVPLVMSLADRVLVMEAGKLVSDGSPHQVAEDPAAITAYLGASEEALSRSGSRRMTRRTKRRGKGGKRPLRATRSEGPRKKTSRTRSGGSRRGRNRGQS